MTWLPSIVTVEPAAEPLSVAEAKPQLAIDGPDFDGPLARWLKAARQHAEAYAGIALITQTRILCASSFADLERLPIAPVQSVSAINYVDTEGVEQTLSTDVWEASLVGLEPEVRLKVGQAWPPARSVKDAIRVTAICGYGDSGAAVPSDILQAILLVVGDWLENREDLVTGTVGRLPNGFETMMAKYRLFL